MVIIKAPIVQIIAVVLAGFIIALEFPAPFLKGTGFHRSIVLRIPLLLLQVFFTALFYQGTNGAIWSLIAAGGYARAVMLGEEMEEAKENRGREEKV
jgi:hypothetical protein